MLVELSLNRSCVVLLLCLSALSAGESLAQGIPLPGVSSSESQPSEDEVNRQELHESLDDVIRTLENDAQRGELLEQLKSLRTSVEAGQDLPGDAAEQREGLLGALADSFEDLGARAKSGDSALDIWEQLTRDAAADAAALFSALNSASASRNVVEAAVLLAAWLALLSALAWSGRQLFNRLDWALELQPKPGNGMLAAHFLRKVLPWVLAFTAMLFALRGIEGRTSARVTVLVLAYASMCGYILATVFDVVIASFTRGHRRVAVAALHRIAFKRLFVIGTLAAFGDAVSGDRLTDLLGNALADWLSVLASVLAGVLCGVLVLRIKRPVMHLIRNRRYSLRREGGTLRDLINLFARIWHIPALLLVGASLTAILITAGEENDSFAKAVLCAVLLIVTLVISSALRRQSERAAARQSRAAYVKRLVRLGYAVTQLVVWTAFIELSLRVWGLSLLGIGEHGAISTRIGQALLGLGLTVLLASLAWIFADSAIERALRGGTGPRGRRMNIVRVQTITPMLRNVVFFTILVIAGIVGLANLGVNVTPLLAGAGVIGLAVGFGAQTLVQDLITGIFILIEDSLAVGDFVEINGYMGTVEGINLRTVKLRDLNAVLHIITFSRIDSIHNMSRQFGVALMKIRIPHDMLIDDAIELMHETARELRRDPRVGHLIRSPLEIQDIHSFEDGCPILRMRLHTAPEYQWNVSRAFNLLLKRRMEAQSVELGAPRLSINMTGEGGVHYRRGGDSGEARDQSSETGQPDS